MDNSSFKVAEDGTIIRIEETQTCSKCHKTFSTKIKFCPDCREKLLNEKEKLLDLRKKSDVVFIIFIGLFIVNTFL